MFPGRLKVLIGPESAIPLHFGLRSVRLRSLWRMQPSPQRPEPAPADLARIQEVLEAIYEKYRYVDDGAVATYIPELGKADPKHFGICLVTAEGHAFRVGDWDKEFTIQSMCKPFAFLMALEQYGVAETLKYVGVEPSGDAFNSIELDPKTTRPFNPMINAGAIAIASLIKTEGVQGFVDRMSEAAGRSLRIDWAVMQSEELTGNRNRAIAYLMRNFGIIDERVDESLRQYFAQCSMLVTCEDVAMMAATLANMGTNPLTGKRVFAFQYIKYVLTVMLTCGLYDYAGGWAYEVGLPAKSGVGGGIFGVVNRQLGISVYSPKLDAQGNSVRGILACKELASTFGLHAFEFTNVGSSFMQWLL
jgi:glutaminase